MFFKTRRGVRLRASSNDYLASWSVGIGVEQGVALSWALASVVSTVGGVFWGSYRCERWGKGQASLHAENRAIDWHLDAFNRADRRAADKLFRLLLAPDQLGNPQALARRMGVEELIWDCGYWGAGMTQFEPYPACFDKHGKRRKRVDPSVAHRNHIHIGLTRAGAARRTSFWSAAR